MNSTVKYTSAEAYFQSLLQNKIFICTRLPNLYTYTYFLKVFALLGHIIVLRA